MRTQTVYQIRLAVAFRIATKLAAAYAAKVKEKKSAGAGRKTKKKTGPPRNVDAEIFELCFGCEDENVTVTERFNKKSFCRQCFLGTRSQRSCLGYDTDKIAKYKSDMIDDEQNWRQELKSFAFKPKGGFRDSLARLSFRCQAKVVVFLMG